MKKLKYLLPILILLFATIVKADDAVTIEVDCGRGELIIGQSITCPVKIIYDNTSFDRVEFDYSSDLQLSFSHVDGLNINSNAGKVNIVADRPFTSEIAEAQTVCNMNVKAGSITTAQSKTITFSNIKVSESGNDSNTHNLSLSPIIINLVENKGDDVDLTLKTIEVNGKKVTGFSPLKNKYENIVVSTETVNIVAHANEPTKTQVTGLGTIAIDKEKPTTRIITVESSDKSKTNKYELVFVYQEEKKEEEKPDTPVAEKSKDNTIKELALFNGEEKLDFEYNNKKTSFDYSVDGSIDKITIMALLNDEKAKFVNKYGPRDINLEYGKNKAELRVQAENGDIKTYTLNITREDNRSTDTTLSSLKVGDVTVNLQKDIYQYKVDVRYNATDSKIDAKPTSSKSTVTFEDIQLIDGENPPVIITVTAENKKKQEYEIIINRLSEAESKIALESIEVVGYSLPFSLDTKVYDLEIKEEDTSLDIVVNPKTVETKIMGNKDLINSSTIVIRVTDDNGTEDYTINIHKPEKNSIEWLCYTVFGVGVFVFLMSLIYASSKKKKRNAF